MFFRSGTCPFGQALRLYELILVVSAGRGVSGLVLAAGVGIHALFERDEIIEQLKWNQMNEGGEPFCAFRHNERVLGGNIVIRGGNGDGGTKRLQFAGRPENLAGAIVGGPAGEHPNERAAGINFRKGAVKNFFSFKTLGGDVAAFLDFQGNFASRGPADAGAENLDARKRSQAAGEGANLRLESQSLAHQHRDAVERGAERDFRQKLFAIGEAQKERSHGGESGGVALGIGESDFLFAGFDQKIGGAGAFAAVFADDADRQRPRGFRAMDSLDRSAGCAGVREDNDRVLGVESERMVQEFEGLLELSAEAAGTKFASPKFGDARGVKRSADADKDEARLGGHGVSDGFDGRSLGENALDQRGLSEDSVVNVVRMSSAAFGHLIFLPRQCIRKGSICGEKLQGTGARMARYLTQHTLACLTRQGAAELAKRLQAAKQVETRRVLVNMQEGKMLVEFEAPSREELEKFLAAEKFHFDWALRIELESTGAGLQPV